MPRKNNSKQTIETVIDISTRLFVEKGYDQTSMQDIVNELGMSKGAIFYHFKSKEDILNAVIERHSEESALLAQRWIDEMDGMLAKDKIITLFEKTMTDPHMNLLNKVLATQANNPHMIIAGIQESVSIIAPELAELFEEGIKDGSITTQYPDECAQAFMLLFCSWCDPNLFPCQVDALHKRLVFLQLMMRIMGADIVSDKLIAESMLYMDKYSAEAN
jgi:AcrR family transcriptional regulator